MSKPGKNEGDLVALQQAAEWFAVLRDEHAHTQDRTAWQAWLDASPLHRRAWQEVEAIHAPFEQLSNIADKQASHNALNQPRTRRQALKLLGIGGMAFVGGMLIKRYAPWQDWATTLTTRTETHRTIAGKTGMVALADGGKLWLNTRTQAKVEYGFSLRRITLLAGEVLMQSAPDSQEPARPLVVDSRHGRLTALGTRFTVQQQADHTLLAVYQGAVAITRQHGKPVVIEAGWQTRFDARRIAHPEPASPAREAWTRGILIADNRRLDDFIAELGDYYPGKLSVAAEVAHLRLMGAYPFNDVPQVLHAIAETLPVRLERTAPGEMALVSAR